MRKIENFFSDYFWLLKPGIWLAIVFWAMQFNWVVVQMYKDNKSFEEERKIDLEKEFSKEYQKLRIKQLEEARAKGNLYGPKDYFEDYKEIKILQNKIGLDYNSEPFMMTDIGNLQAMSTGNVGKGKKYSWEDVNIAAEDFHNWLEAGGAIGDEFHEKMDNIPWSTKLKMILNWFFSLYSRGFFLVLFLYLVRMAERKGILETILADKKRFLLSIVLWPLFIFKYPFNIIREIIVEAEYRRMKSKLFSYLTENEKRKIRDFAESGLAIFSWKQFLKFQGMKPVHSFAVALAVTLLFAILPLQKEVQAKSYYSGGVVSYCQVSSHLPRMAIDEQGIENSEIKGNGRFCLVETLCQEYFPEVYCSLDLGQNFCFQEVARKIEHVPLRRLFGFVSDYFVAQS